MREDREMDMKLGVELESVLRERVAAFVRCEAEGNVDALYGFVDPAIRESRAAEYDFEPQRTVDQIRAYTSGIDSAELLNFEVEAFAEDGGASRGNVPMAIVLTCVRYNVCETPSSFRTPWVLRSGQWYTRATGKVAFPAGAISRSRSATSSNSPGQDAWRQYRYVGPGEVRDSALASSPAGTPILNMEGLFQWMASRAIDIEPDGSVVATFTVSTEAVLLLAPRRSEHVACAGGEPVLSAGEITFSSDGSVTEVSNQSTGYCPEPASWPAVASALDVISADRPDGFTTRIVFRLCTGCNERNIVKDDWFVCDLCGTELPEYWNWTD